MTITAGIPRATGSERYTLRVVPGGCTHCSALGDGVREMRVAVIGAAQLEREDGLQVFAFQQDLVVEPARQAAGFFAAAIRRPRRTRVL